MDKTHWSNSLIHIVLLFSLALGTTSCGQAAGTGPRVWIDSPADGALVPSGTPVTVMSHAYAREGVAEVLLTIDGAAYRRDAPASPGTQYVQVSQDWLPPGEGTYAVQVQAYAVGGQISNMASITVRVGGAVTITDTPMITLTPTITATLVPPTDTPTNTPLPPPPGAVIQFWADPPEIQAGACSTIRWHVENAAQVIFGGVAQPFDGAYKDCMCQTQRYQLTVVKLDASQEIRTMDIGVKGQCVTPTTPAPPPPPQDTTPPPVPTPMVPANGLAIACKSSQGLAWLPVTDPSGPVKYYVKLELQVKKGQWKPVGGYGPISGKQVNVNVQCGGIYRWIVRAEDAAGNISDWSAPSLFSINLD